MNAQNIISAAFPGNWSAAKSIAKALKITPRQGKRIVVTGKIPMVLEDPALDYLAAAIQRRKALLEKAEDDLKAIRYSRMVGRAESRMAPTHFADSSRADELAARQASLPLKETDNGF